MRRARYGSLVLLGMTALFCSSSGWALERELGGVRLGAKALNLLTLPGFGQPDFIGPLGAVGGQRAVAAPGRSAGPAAPAASRAAAAGARSSAAGNRAGQMRGRRGNGRGDFGALPGGNAGMARVPSSFDVELTQGRMGDEMGMGRRMRAGRAGSGATGAAAGQSRAPQARTTQTQAPQGDLFWLYRRPAGAVLVLTLDRKGEVTAITLSGSVPYPGGRTSKNVNLGTDYMEVIRQYGYPDQAVTSGAVLQLTYIDNGVRFTLEAMRVNQITIGAYVGTARGTPVPVAVPQGPIGPGLTIDQLKGYM